MWRNVYFNRPTGPRRPGAALWRDMRRLQREMDRMLSDGWAVGRSRFPAMNIWAGPDGLIATAEVPGIDPEAIEISVVGETLTVSGTRQREEAVEGTQHHRRERSVGDFCRTFELPYRVDADNVEARFRNGVLQIALPRLPQDRPRKIEIKAG
jgi:HSP20 family protein